MSLAAREAGEGPLGIICGGGALPFAVADAAMRAGRPVILFAIVGAADAERIAAYPHHWVKLGQFGRFRRLAANAACRDLVFIGTLVRPSLSAIALDFTTLRLLPRVAGAMRGGDDRLLSKLGGIFESYGFRLVRPQDIAPEVVIVEGLIGRRKPSARDLADIDVGLALLNAIARFDIGQGAVIVDNRVIAVEAAEGTDAMLARVVEMRRSGRVRSPVGRGVLVKAVKPEQDRRFDLPAIGPDTVAGAARAGLAGIAVVAGEALIAEPSLVAAAADRAKLFVTGVRQPPA